MQRYDINIIGPLSSECDYERVKNDDGDYILYSDHLKEAAALTERVDHYEEIFSDVDNPLHAFVIYKDKYVIMKLEDYEKIEALELRNRELEAELHELCDSDLGELLEKYKDRAFDKTQQCNELRDRNRNLTEALEKIATFGKEKNITVWCSTLIEVQNTARKFVEVKDEL